MLYNRDLSWLGFNFRVLQEAADEKVPLFERIKFIAIFSSNLDEFFRVRYPSVFAFLKLNPKTQAKASVGFNEDIPAQMQQEINRQLKFFGGVLVDELIPELKENGINFYYNSTIRAEHQPEIRELFLSNVLSFIQPLWLEGNIAQRFFPENNRLYFVVSLKGGESDMLRHAVINIPSNKLPRFFVLTPLDNQEFIIFIDDIIRDNIIYLFPGLEITGVYSIKFNRDAELNLDEEYSEDLLGKIEKQLRKREYGPPSRFLFENGMPRNLQLFLASIFELKFEEMFAGGRYHNLSDLASFPTFDKNLKYPKRRPLPAMDGMHSGDIFDLLDRQDILLHLPYHSYNPVLSFFNQAAVDTNVAEIYITLYRVAADSHIVNALISAAKNGKQVTVFIELKARFDEANNIKWSREMKEAGIKMIYSMPHIKVHSKIALVRKVTPSSKVNYAILSTGNFNEVTAQFYTDHLLMTTDTAIIDDMSVLFKFLQKEDKDGLKEKLKFGKLLVSQFNLVAAFEELVEAEIKKAANGQKALISIKMNNLEEPGMINLLYKASNAGVNIRLCIRGICCLVPVVDGFSKNIVVRRLVDRYLEHSRIFIFGNGDGAEVIMGSADWMNRNLYHRIEVCVPITDNSLKKELTDYFELQWADNVKAVELTASMGSKKVDVSGPSIAAQPAIYDYLNTYT